MVGMRLQEVAGLSGLTSSHSCLALTWVRQKWAARQGERLPGSSPGIPQMALQRQDHFSEQLNPNVNMRNLVAWYCYTPP